MKTLTAIESPYPHRNQFDLFYGGRYLPTTDYSLTHLSRLAQYVRTHYPTVERVIIRRADGSVVRHTVNRLPGAAALGHRYAAHYPQEGHAVC